MKPYLIALLLSFELCAFGATSITPPPGVLSKTNAAWVRGREFTGPGLLTAAKNYATNGDTVFVAPGGYSSTNILKNSVNWFLSPGCMISNRTSIPGGIFDNTSLGTPGAVTSTVFGAGILLTASSFPDGHGVQHGTVSSDNALSKITIECDQILGGSDDTAFYAVCARDGRMIVRCNTINSVFANAGGFMSSVLWHNGYCEITCSQIIADVGYGVWCAGTAAGDFYLNASEIFATNYAAIFFEPTFSENTAWITVNKITGNDGGVSEGTITMKSGKLYLKSQKIKNLNGALPIIAQTGGRLWLDSDKVTRTNVAPFMKQSGGKSIYRVGEWEDLQTSTRQCAAAWVLSAGTNTMNGGQATINSCPGYKITGGLANLNLMRISTQQSTYSTNHPVWVTGGTITLNGTVLVATNNQWSIFASSAQNVIGLGSHGNFPTTNITVLGGIHTVNSNVQ